MESYTKHKAGTACFSANVAIG